MESSINSWEGGLNGDLSRVHLNSNQYRSASNFRVLTDKGSSSFSLENIKGNVFNKTIPNIGAVQKITIGVADPTQTISINGSTPVIFDTTNKDTEELFNFISTDASFAAEYGVEYNVYFNTLYVLIVPISPFTLTITLVGLGLTLDSTYIPAQNNLEVIGSTSINDDIYILTTNGTSKSPTTDYGQIWKLVINDADNTSVLTLIYNNKINFSTYNAIAPTAITGRYENASIQRIYWTDFYNKVRQINVKDPQAFALDISLLELVPAIDFDIPLLSEIHEGGTATVKVGVWQMAYRFKNTTGSVTGFSPLSNIIPIVNHSESISVLTNSYNEFRGYTGDAYGTTTTKVVSWTINNLDPNYDRIECVLLVREKKDDVPTIYSFNEEAISGRQSIEITVDGDILAGADITTLTLSEFLALSGSFTHAKTITTKDNRLIAGNIRTASADIDFDARAYRFPVSSYIFPLTETGITTNYDTNPPSGPWSIPSDWSVVDDESDAINPSNITNRYRRASATLGGDGPNISYEFVSIAIPSDVANNAGGTDFDFIATNLTAVAGFRSTTHDLAITDTTLDLNVNSSDINGLDVLQEYNLNLPQTNYRDMKYPQYSSNYWGYQQNEIYRVGIQFYDKAKNPYFVKWIGDIKFPDINDTCIPANTLYYDGTQTSQTEYVKSFVTITSDVNWPGKCIAWITQLGLKVNVTIPAELTEIISGYSIVRVKREESDKTVIAEGIITSVADIISNIYYIPNSSAGNQFSNGYTGTPDDTVCFFNTPNHLISGITEPRAGDKLTVRRAFQSAADLNTTDLASGNPQLYYIYRLYNDIATLNQTFSLAQVLNLGIGQDGTTFGGAFPVNNNDNANVSLGNQCYYFDIGVNLITSLPLQNYASAVFKLYATIDRVLTNQYGGNTYGDRANNEYILCSHFRSVKNSVIAYVDSPMIFGGDTMNYHIDMQRNIKDWPGLAATKSSSTFIFPAGSCANVGFRYGTFVNYNLLTDDGATASGTETYDYNTVYSAENDVVKFFPKPEPYLINDEFVNRFVISEIKINGELNDSWSVFLPLNYWDVEGTYGPINACDVLNDQVYFAQDRAFGQLLVNPRTAIAGTDGEIIQLGKGDVIDSHKYASTEIGSKHQFSFLKSAYNIFFLDIRHKKIYAFNPSKGLDPLSDLKGMHGWLQRNVKNKLESIDKPVYLGDVFDGQNGIHGVYDYTNNELIYTIFEQSDTRDVLNKYTIVYSDKLNYYTADNYSHYPKTYITNHRKFLSPNPSGSTTYKDLYLHNFGDYGNFYGAHFDSHIEFLSNKYPEITKVFTNLSWETELQDGTTLIDIDSGLTPIRESFTRLDVSTDYQSNSVIFNILTNLRRRFRTWTSEVPKDSAQSAYMSSGFFGKMRDKVLKLKFSYTNTNNRRLIVHRITTFFGINIPK